MFILFEAFGIFLFGLLGTYLIWIFNKKRKSFGALFAEYGYILGIIGALVTIVVIALFRSI